MLYHNWYYNLVGGIPTPLKNMSSPVGIIVPNIRKRKNVPNHQPVMVLYYDHMESCGIMWNHMESYGIIWNHMESHGPWNDENNSSIKSWLT